MTTPIGAAPDEPAHIVKAASVVRGQFVGEPSEFGHVVQVPRYIASSQARTCFAFRPETSAACAFSEDGDPSESIDGTTTAGLYNPVYYVLVGWPSLIAGDETGIYLMRLVSGALCSVFLAVSFLLLSGWRRPALLLLSFVVAVTPTVLFLASAVNPNSLEVVTVLATFVGMLTIVLQREDRYLAVRCAVVAVSAALAVNSRGLSPVWVAAALLVPLLFVRWERIRFLLGRRPVIVTIAVVAVSTAAALVWLLRSNSLTAAFDRPIDRFTAPSVGATPVSGFLSMLEQTFDLGRGMIGLFGWLDTPAPTVVYFIWSGLLLSLVGAAVVVARGRALAATVALLASTILLPPLIQGFYITGGGFIWQGRYTLPIFVCLVLGAGAVLAERTYVRDAAILQRFAALVLGAWASAHVYSFVTALKRYAVGTDGTWLEILRQAEWSPPGGALLWTSMIVLAAAACAVLIFRRIVSSLAETESLSGDLMTAKRVEGDRSPGDARRGR